MAANEVKTKKVDEVITAVYKVNLHCLQCARDIKRPLLRTQGVQSVDFNMEKNEVKVKGAIDVIKIHKHIEKLSKKKVVLVSPQIKPKEPEKKVVVKETKEQIVRTTSVKVHMHCEQCGRDLRNKLLKHKDIHSVKTDFKAQTLTVQGTIESEKLVVYLRKKVHKNAALISSKPEKKEEKKVEEKIVKTTEKKEEKKVEEKTAKTTEKKEEKKVEEKTAKTNVESKEAAEFKAEKKVEVKTKEGDVPYFIHYVYAPQLFSDENPNACFIM